MATTASIVPLLSNERETINWRPNLGISNRNRKEIAACSFLFNSTLTVRVPCLIVGDSEKDQLVSLALIWPG
ncbi:MAG: hypothetical protein WBE44_15655, partial [Terriglobales bacterium]